MRSQLLITAIQPIRTFLRKSFNAAYMWVGIRTFFWWPSWSTELFAGIVIDDGIALAASFNHPLLAFPLAHLFSFIYEKYIDPKSWSLKDFLQREVGIVIGFFLFIVLSH